MAMRIIFSTLIISFPCSASYGQDFNVMTFNIRLNTRSDSLNAWPFRANKVLAQISFHKVDILGVQEAVPMQITDL